MPFIDRKPSWKSVVLLVLLVPAMYLLNMQFTQVRLTDEAVMGAFVQDFVYSPNLFCTRIYGQEVAGFPLYSWCAAVTSFFGMPTNMTLRMPAFIALVILSIVCGIMAKRYHGMFAGVTAATVVLTSIVSFKVGTLAQPELLCALLLTTAWFSLYHLGWKGQRWVSAWTVSLCLVFLATFGIGFKAIVMFYLPLLLSGRKTNGIRQIQSPLHVLVAGCYVALLMCWQFLAPQQPFFNWNAFSISTSSGIGYFSRFFSMPSKVCYYLFPWTLFAWAPFCLAQRRFEQDNHFCHYLRSIIVSNFVLFWLLPGGSALHLLPLLGPMAVLLGVHSEVVLRRCKEFFTFILNVVSWLTLVIALGGALFWLGALTSVQLVRFETDGVSSLPDWVPLVCSGILCLVVFVVSTQLLLLRNRRSFRSCLLWAIFAVRMTSLGIWELPSMVWYASARMQRGQILAEGRSSQHGRSLEEQMADSGIDRVYLYLPSVTDVPKILIETFYLQCKFQLVRNPMEELSEAKTMILLSPFKPPLPQLEWKEASDAVNLNVRYHTKCDNFFGKLPDYLEKQANQYLHTRFHLKDPQVSLHSNNGALIWFKRKTGTVISTATYSDTRIYLGVPKENKTSVDK